MHKGMYRQDVIGENHCVCGRRGHPLTQDMSVKKQPEDLFVSGSKQRQISSTRGVICFIASPAVGGVLFNYTPPFYEPQSIYLQSDTFSISWRFRGQISTIMYIMLAIGTKRLHQEDFSPLRKPFGNFRN